MPTRLIRETLLDSHRYAMLSTEAKLLYVHLLLLADDFGCVGVSETFLRRRAFHDAPSGQKIAALLTELSDADLIRCYDHDRACFAFIPRFRQRLQRQSLKHPKPPESLFQDDEHAKALFSKNNTETSIPPVGQPLWNRAVPVGQPPEVKRREKKQESVAALPDWLPMDSWNGWIASRRQKPTGRAIELSIAKLTALRADGHDPKSILDESTMRGWTGLFAPKDAPKSKRADGLAL